jgi:hypothetical protein
MSLYIGDVLLSTPYAGAAGMLLDVNVHKEKIEIISNYQFLCSGQGMKQI